MAKFEQFVNNAVTSLNGGISNVATSIIVNNASKFPTSGNFRILIEEELIQVTAISGSTFTAIRGIESSSNVAHSDGAAVKAILTEGALERHTIETIGQWATNTPKMGGFTDKDGTKLIKTDFTEVNLGSAAFVDFDDGIKCTSPGGAGNDAHLLVRTLPATPYTITVALTQFYRVTGAAVSPQAVLGFRDSGTGRLHNLVAHASNDDPFGIEILRMTSPTVTSTSDFATQSFRASLNVKWLQVFDNNTNFTFRVSPNGVDWIDVASVTRTVWLATPNQYVIGFDQSGNNTTMDLLTYFHYLSIV